MMDKRLPLFDEINLKYTNGTLMKPNSKNIFDEYFTKPQIAKNLYEKTRQIIAQFEKLSGFTWT